MDEPPARAIARSSITDVTRFGIRRLMLSCAPRPAARYDLSMGTITRSYRIRAYPNGAQRRLLDRWFGSARWLTQWKRTAGHEWLAAVPATCLTQCLRDQDSAFRNFFAHRAKYRRAVSRPTAKG